MHGRYSMITTAAGEEMRLVVASEGIRTESADVRQRNRDATSAPYEKLGPETRSICVSPAEEADYDMGAKAVISK